MKPSSLFAMRQLVFERASADSNTVGLAPALLSQPKLDRLRSLTRVALRKRHQRQADPPGYSCWAIDSGRIVMLYPGA